MNHPYIGGVQPAGLKMVELEKEMSRNGGHVTCGSQTVRPYFSHDLSNAEVDTLFQLYFDGTLTLF